MHCIHISATFYLLSLSVLHNEQCILVLAFMGTHAFYKVAGDIFCYTNHKI